jgi:hypothetical protein
MASHPISPIPTPSPEPGLDEKPLTYDEAWELLLSLEGSMKGWFPDEGGPSAVLLKEREAWGE